MGKSSISNLEIRKIISLRKAGHSLPEICKITHKGNSTVYKYVKDIEVKGKYLEILKNKQGGSKKRAAINWESANKEAESIIGKLNKRDRILILMSLYWGEGNKREFDLNNGDPIMIKVFIEFLKEIGVTESDLTISIRVYEDINVKKAKYFWSRLLNISPQEIRGVNILKGKKVGKLKFGMCRIRIKKGGAHFKLIMSMISLVKSEFMLP